MMNEILDYLAQKNNYAQLLRKWNENKNEGILFEVLFAYWFEKRELSLNYEVNVNHENKKSVDFNFQTKSCVTVNLELVRPDLNEAISDKR